MRRGDSDGRDTAIGVFVCTIPTVKWITVGGKSHRIMRVMMGEHLDVMGSIPASSLSGHIADCQRGTSTKQGSTMG